MGDVTREQPGFAVFHCAQGVGCLGGHVVIALHHLRPVDDDLADLALAQDGFAVVEADDLHVHVGQGHADGTRLVDAVERVAVRGGRRLGQAIAFEDLAACQLFKLFFGLAQQRSRARDAGFDRRQVVFASLDVGVIVDAVVQRGHAGEDGGFVLADVVQHVLQVARVWHHHHAAAIRHGKVHARHHAVDVEQRDGHQHHFLARLEARHPRFDLQGVGHHIAVHGHRALRDARGPARVLKQSRIIGTNLQGGARSAGILCDQVLHPDLALGESALDAESAFLLLRQGEEQAQQRRQGFLQVGHDQLLDPGLGLGGLDRLVEVGHHEHHFDARIAGLMLDLGGGVERVGRHHHAARLEDGIIGHHELRRVRHEDAHAVALLHAHVHQRGSQVVGDVVHLLVRNDRALEDRAGAVGILARGIIQKVKQRRLGIFDCGGHPFVVMLYPGSVFHGSSFN